MNIFEEYLEYWDEDFDPRWRPVDERLAERTRVPGAESAQLDRCRIYPILQQEDAPWVKSGSILIWRSVFRPSGQGGVTLAGLMMDNSVYCGTLQGCNLDDLYQSDLSWASYRLTDRESEAALADFFADWLLEQLARSVDELIDRKTISIRSQKRIADERAQSQPTGKSPRTSFQWKFWSGVRGAVRRATDDAGQRDQRGIA